MTHLKKQKRSVDKKLLVLTLILTILGLIAVADVSAPTALNVFSDRFFFAKQQLLWASLGIILMFFACLIPYTFWGKIAPVFFFINLLLLIAVLIPGIGLKLLGARRWIGIGDFSFQPSELIKLSLAFYFSYLAEKEKKFLAFLVPLALVFILIMLQPDFGTTLIVACIGLAQIFASGVNLIYFTGTLILGGLVSSVLIYFSDYRRERLMTFIKQTQDPLGKSYHIRQVLLSLGLGGLFGVGLGESRQKFLFLPEAATDSIFAIIAEELGFIGASILIILLALLILRAIKISHGAPDKFSRVLAVGIASWIGVQIFLNIASMVAITPLTGVPLPFFSYGGSSLITILFAIGILLNISRFKPVETKRQR